MASIGMPRNSLARFQIIEYFRAFLGGRIGMSMLKSLMIISVFLVRLRCLSSRMVKTTPTTMLTVATTVARVEMTSMRFTRPREAQSTRVEEAGRDI